MLLSLEEFVRDLVTNQLITAAEIRAVEEKRPADGRPGDAQGLAKELVRSGRLTKYQAANALQGKAKNLVFDDYLVLDVWAAGGSSQLYQAEHRKMKRRVALRILPPFAAAKSSTASARFQREAQAAARLEHPHLLAAYHAGEAHGVPYLVLQYVEGQNLETLVREQGPLPLAEALGYTIQAARALAYAHEKGVVHRDVKPANLLLDQSGTIKIVGLGLARIEDDTEKSVTQTGELVGTAEYMSPEQGKNAREVDARSDVYSLGCTLFYLLTGQLIYSGKTIAERLTAHSQQPIPKLRDFRPELPAAVQEVFAKMVAKLPADRYASMASAIDALQRCQAAASKATGSKVVKLVETVASEKTRHATAKLVGGIFATIIAPIIVAVLMKFFDSAGTPAPAAGTPNAAATNIQSAAAPTTAGSPSAVAVGSPAAASTPARDAPPPEKLQPVQPELVFPSEIKGAHPPLAPPPKLAMARRRAFVVRNQKAWANFLGLPIKADNTIGMPLVLMPPAEFTMGITDEEVEAILASAKNKNKASHQHDSKPSHSVTLTRPFYMSATEVTIGQFRQFVDATGHRTEAERRPDVKGSWKLPGYEVNDDSPVSLVTWGDCVAFCNWLSDHEGLPRAYIGHKRDIWQTAPTSGYRLPSEAQWEFACRAGTNTLFSFGDTVDDASRFAWFMPDSGRRAHAVGTLLPNAFGLFDMHGNILEWCNDWYDAAYYSASPATNPEGPLTGTDRVVRGGAWSMTWMNGRSAWRGRAIPESALGIRGFRVVRNGPSAK